MKRSQLFLGIAITCVMMVLTANVARSFSHNQSEKIETSKQELTYGVPPNSIGIPGSNSGDQNIPEFKVAPSVSSLPSALYISTNQEICCLFEILFEVETFEDYQPQISVTRDRFFLRLFRVVISPNAP